MSVVIPSEVIAAAQASMSKWRVPASVTIAQWALESGWGQHIPPESFNPFGIKATSSQLSVKCWTTEIIRGKRVRVAAFFRKFSSWLEAFDEHGEFLVDDPRYARCFSQLDGMGFAGLLGPEPQGCGYATDPDYAKDLQSIIMQYNLEQYDGGTST